MWNAMPIELCTCIRVSLLLVLCVFENVIKAVADSSFLPQCSLRSRDSDRNGEAKDDIFDWAGKQYEMHASGRNRQE